MKVKFSGSNIILSAESAEEARVLQAARAIAEPVVFPKFAESRLIREPIVRPEDSRWENFGQEMPLLQRIRAWVSAKWRTARGSRATSHG